MARQRAESPRRPRRTRSWPRAATFLKTACVNCHRVRGTLASGMPGPDLTHLMARKTIASGMVDNDPKERASGSMTRRRPSPAA
ncbi:MAG: c-type cytochrome [Gemmataceae bacterium]